MSQDLEDRCRDQVLAIHRLVSIEPDRSGVPQKPGLQKVAAAVRPAEAKTTMVRSMSLTMSSFVRDRKIGMASRPSGKMRTPWLSWTWPGTVYGNSRSRDKRCTERSSRHPRSTDRTMDSLTVISAFRIESENSFCFTIIPHNTHTQGAAEAAPAVDCHTTCWVRVLMSIFR